MFHKCFVYRKAEYPVEFSFAVSAHAVLEALRTVGTHLASYQHANTPHVSAFLPSSSLSSFSSASPSSSSSHVRVSRDVRLVDQAASPLLRSVDPLETSSAFPSSSSSSPSFSSFSSASQKVEALTRAERAVALVEAGRHWGTGVLISDLGCIRLFRTHTRGYWFLTSFRFIFVF